MGLCSSCFANFVDILFVVLTPVICFLYIISPIDFVPEGVLGWIGLTDDALVIIAGVVGQIILICRAIKRKKAF